MTLHVIGFSTSTDTDGVPTAVPTQVMTKDLPTVEDAMSYIRSYNRTLPAGKTFLFSMTGTPEPKADTAKDDVPADVPSPDIPKGDDAEAMAAMCCFDYALNSIGCQLTGLLSAEPLTSWLDDAMYDELVEAQNKIVRVLEWMDGGEDDVEETADVPKEVSA